MLGVRTIAGRCDKMRRPFREPYDGANQAYARMAPEVGFEPTTNRLTADRSTTELLRNPRISVSGQASLSMQAFKQKVRRLGGHCLAE